MWTTKLFEFPFYELYFYFLIYSFLGWVLESLFVSASTKQWVNRGFLRGPFCPIYGTGAVLVLVTLTPVLGNLAWVFIGGVFIATIVEYVISYVLEKIFHATWWDYSQMPLNFQGRICLRRSLEWGALSVVLLKVIHPFIGAFVQRIPHTIAEFAGAGILIYLIADASVTVMNIFQLKEKIERLEEARLGLREKMEGVKLFEARKELIEYLEGLPISEAMASLKEKIEEHTGQLLQLRAEERLRFEYFLSEMREKLERRQRIIRESTRTERRLYKAFPRLRFEKYNEALKAFQEEYAKKKK